MLLTSLLAALLLSPVDAGRPSKVPKGFVTTKGSDFYVDGKKFAFVGANSYWTPLLTTEEDVDRTLKGMRDHGVKVLRTWGFNAINATNELDDALKSGLTYYQLWKPDGTYELNEGPQGLKRLDYVVKAAKKYGIKLILPFTNNWIGYGGIDLYIRWMAPGSTQDVFYTNPKIIAAYQKYVKTIVNRYKDSDTIMAWELVNEARCLGELPSGPNCNARNKTITNWYKQQSDFIRKLDPYHLITTGGEGHFNWKNPPHFWYNHQYVSDYNYNGNAGEDFDEDLLLDNIDFGTYHMYPLSWYPQLIVPGSNFSVQAWGLQWIDQHSQAAKKAGKPVILEEFSVPGYENKTEWYPAWVQRALDTKHAGLMTWQYGQLGLTENGGNRLIKYADAIIDGASPNDGNTYYKNQTELWNIFQRAAKIQDSRSG